MTTYKSKARLFTTSAFALTLISAEHLSAQTNPTAHNLTLSNVAETVDAHGRRVFVAHVEGDLPGVFTLALVVGPTGTVTGGEWALTVSYIQFGPPDHDGDGDPSESLVQRGVVKGAVTRGTAVLAADGLASDLSGVQLSVSGATVQFASAKTGSGYVLGSSMNKQAASSGNLTITF